MIATCVLPWISTRTFWRAPRSSLQGGERPQGVSFPSWPVARRRLQTAPVARSTACRFCHVRTTLDIDEDVLESAKELAARRRTTAGRVLSELARSALAPRDGTRRKRNGVRSEE